MTPEETAATLANLAFLENRVDAAKRLVNALLELDGTQRNKDFLRGGKAALTALLETAKEEREGLEQ